MRETILVTLSAPETFQELLALLGRYDLHELELRVIAAGEITGKRADSIIIDDACRPSLAEFINSLPEPVRPALDTHTKRPRSKGERHRNKRYRWS